MKPVVPESAILNACIRWLYLHKVFCWRNNSGALRDTKGNIVRFGFKGSADIIGLMPNTSPHRGRFLCIEVKSSKGKQTPEQAAFQVNIESHGGLYFLIRDMDELEFKLKPML